MNNQYRNADAFAAAHEAYDDDLIQGQLGDGGNQHPSGYHKYQTLEESWEEADRYYASLQEQPARKAIAQTLPITSGIMQGQDDMAAFARLSPEQKQTIVQFAKQNGIAKYVGSDNVGMIRQAWRNRAR